MDLHCSTFHNMANFNDIKNKNNRQAPSRPKAIASHWKPSSSWRSTPQISSQSRQILRPHHDLKTRPSHHRRHLLLRHGQTSPPNPRPISLLQNRPRLHDHSQPRSFRPPVDARFTSLAKPQTSLQHPVARPPDSRRQREPPTRPSGRAGDRDI